MIEQSANPNTPLLGIKSQEEAIETIDWLNVMLKKGNYTDTKFIKIEKQLQELKTLISEPLNSTHEDEPSILAIETIKQFTIVKYLDCSVLIGIFTLFLWPENVGRTNSEVPTITVVDSTFIQREVEIKRLARQDKILHERLVKSIIETKITNQKLKYKVRKLEQELQDSLYANYSLKK